MAYGDPPPLPGYLQQQNTPGMTGGMNNMIRALLAGNQQSDPATQAATAAGMPPGPPTSLAPPGPTPMGGAMPSGSFGGPTTPAGPQGGSPVPYMSPGGTASAANPMMQALMTQPPNPMGQGSQNAVY